MPARLIVPCQVHGNEVVVVADEGDVPVAEALAADGIDGIVVGIGNVAALLNSADCLLLVIVSPDGAFAVAHAGWRGAIARIAGKAARVLERRGDVPASQFNAYIGPHIRSECFEVGEEVALRFQEEFGSIAVPDSRHVSLAEAVRADLVGAGLSSGRIADAGICTKCNPDLYFSYRASCGVCGRHAAFAVKLEK